MEQLIQSLHLLLVLVIPCFISSYLWPRLQRWVPKIKMLDSPIQQATIVVLNATAAVIFGLVVPGFGPLALGIGAAGAGGLTVLAFNTGKRAGVPFTAAPRAPGPLSR